MAEMVRVTLLPTSADGASAGDRQIILDLTIDATGTAVGPFPAFGRVGDFRKPETLYPFTLMMDGRMDYGALAHGGAGEERLEIRSTRLEVGAEVTRRSDAHSETLVIASVTSLTGS